MAASDRLIAPTRRKKAKETTPEPPPLVFPATFLPIFL
jgi:hypothetical protein